MLCLDSQNSTASIIDVTDPTHPQYLAHIPGTPGNYEEGGAPQKTCGNETRLADY
jgi:hypothetical protein